MKPEHKILNDPVYGFTTLPFGILYDVVEHPYFQRLRRIKQVGLSHYVYPGALHSRFHHAIGALHLTKDAIEILRSKSVEITEEEAMGVQLAVLLHDIGHGPYSHALEGHFIPVSHERLTLGYMRLLNEEFDGKLDLAIAIFRDKYPKKFLHELVSSQLDMDRMDYLNRDSYYTGVAEGVIGYDRIIKMLNVHEGRLVVEEKGIYSVEKFLMSRKLMYWQVYLHKAVLSAEQMLVRLFKYYKEECDKIHGQFSPAMDYFIHKRKVSADQNNLPKEVFEKHAQLDDTDVDFWMKSLLNDDNQVLRTLSDGLLNRNLFRIWLQKNEFSQKEKKDIYNKLHEEHGIPKELLPHLVIEGEESNRLYTQESPEIQIFMKSGEVKPLSLETDSELDTRLLTRYFICHPKYF
jgi:hypothetical protein